MSGSLLVNGLAALSPGRVALEYIGFLAYFAIFGALGFRFIVVRRWASALAGADAEIGARAARGAATIGAGGAVLVLVGLAGTVHSLAVRAHTTAGAVLQRLGGRLAAPALIAVAMLIAFLIARRRSPAAWAAAGLLALALAFQPITSGKWGALVNPVHEVAAGLWIGTLATLVIVGLPAVLRAPAARERRGALVAELVAHFSPLALTAGGVLVLSGLTTAWLHLHHLSALWTSAYGLTLIVKLCLVAAVFALGAWNWRRMRPRLGGEEAAYALRRSARAELFVAALVLVATAVLVSLPGPGERPRAPAPSPAASAPQPGAAGD